MRVTRQKHHRKIVKFYKASSGFRDPFKILCDGTFIHHLLVNRITPADTALSKILSAPVKIFTTRCVLAELKRLGDPYSESLNAACNLMPARCDHEKRKSAVDCITEVIGEKNPEHFFVATQDVDLRKKLQEIPAVPLIFALRNALLLESPSEAQRQFAKSAEDERSHMTELEYKLLHIKKKKRLATGEPGDSGDDNKDVGDDILKKQAVKPNDAIKRANVKDKVQFKRKKAKGPNPLSCKKKQSDENPKPVSRKKSDESDEMVRSRSRKRKRSRKHKNLAEATA